MKIYDVYDNLKSYVWDNLKYDVWDNLKIDDDKKILKDCLKEES